MKKGVQDLLLKKKNLALLFLMGCVYSYHVEPYVKKKPRTITIAVASDSKENLDEVVELLTNGNSLKRIED